jgi:hypothetical protein
VDAVAYKRGTDLGDRRVTVYRGRGVKVDFAMSRAGIRKIAMGPELLGSCRSVIVDRAMPYAIRNSPRGRLGDADGDPPFVTQWRVSEGSTVLVGLRRVSVKLINVSPHAAAVEFINPKTGRGHGYGILAKTLAHLHGEASGVAGTRARKRATAPFVPEQHPRGPRGRFIPKRATTPEGQVGDAIGDAFRRRR